MRSNPFRLIFLALIASLLFALPACKKENQHANCMEWRLDDIRNDRAPEIYNQVWIWETEGQRYYVLMPGCCDRPIYLRTPDCEIVCTIGGGWGGGLGNCDLGEVNRILVWDRFREL